MVRDHLIEKVSMYEQMKSGDLVVFSGSCNLSDLISRATDSPYTHVGIVLRVNDMVCILESNTAADSPDVLSLQVHGGVIIRDLKHVVEDSKCGPDPEKVWWAPRTEPLTEEQEEKLTTFALGIQGRPYDYIQAALSPFDGLDALMCRNEEESRSKLFCSELVVMCELHVTGMVYHNDYKIPINASTIVPREVLELHVSGVPIWGEMVSL